MSLKLFVLIIIFGAGPAVQAQTCPSNSHWVKAHSRAEYIRADGVSVSAAYVIGHCRTKSKIYEFWIGKFVNGRIDGWPHTKEQFKNWSAKEIELAIAELAEVPEFLWTDVALYRASKSESPGNQASSAKGVVVLYDSAFNKGGNVARYLTHELGHEVFRSMSEFNLTAYRMAAEWTKKGSSKKLIYSSHQRRFVAPDGANGPDEDFANNLEYYIFEPQKLKFKSPRLYDWYAVEYGDKIKNMGGQ